jgi:hypothetical protein
MHKAAATGMAGVGDLAASELAGAFRLLNDIIATEAGAVVEN